MNFTVIGAGLAGVESAWQIAKFGYNVTLIESFPLHIKMKILPNLSVQIL